MKKPDVKISVVIPAYNEQDRIVKTLRNVAGFLARQYPGSEVIIVNDGSQDRTLPVIKSNIGKLDPTVAIKTISLRRNMGKGRAVKKGVLSAKKKWILVMDADGSTPVKEVDRLLRKKNDADVLYGSRYLDRSLLERQQPLTRRIIGRLGNAVIRVLLGVNLADTQCGFKLFNKDIAGKLFKRACIDRWGWDIEILVICKVLNISAIEVPVVWRHSKGSRFRAIGGIIKTFSEVIKIRYNLYKNVYYDKKYH